MRTLWHGLAKYVSLGCLGTTTTPTTFCGPLKQGSTLARPRSKWASTQIFAKGGQSADAGGQLQKLLVSASDAQL